MAFVDVCLQVEFYVRVVTVYQLEIRNVRSFNTVSLVARF
jgi:hypothetical protein